MDLSNYSNGQSRVIIEHVSPEIESGRYAVKAIIGDSIKVTADIFTDGHDHLSAFLKYKKNGDETWQEVRMQPTFNDNYEGSFLVDSIGYYSYTIEAFIDHGDTWLHEILLKIKDGQYVDVELLIGADLLEKMIADGADIKTIKSLKKLFSEKSEYKRAVEFVESDEMRSLVQNYPHRQYTSTYRELKLWVDRKKAGFSAWYSMFPRSAASAPNSHGTFEDVTKNVLPKVKKMGFDVLYIPPIHPIGKAFRKGKNNNVNCTDDEPGVPYAIGSELGGHTAIHSELGTLDDFKKMIQSFETEGIEVAMDLAIQCSPDHPWAQQHPYWFKIRPDGTIQYAENPPKKYQDIYPLNYETEKWRELWLELKHVVFTWAEWGIRIIRVDNPHTKSFQFWEWIIEETHKVYPDMIFLSEAFTRPRVMENLAKVGFTQSYTYYTWRNSKAEIIEYLNILTQLETSSYFRPNFWPNTHDILPHCLQSGSEPMYLIRYFMAATMSGNYGIFGPVFENMVSEPMPGKEEYLNSEKYEIAHWNWESNNKLIELISKVNKARNENKALQQTNTIQFCTIENDNLLAYFKTDKEQNHLLAIVNLDANCTQSGWVKVPVHLAGIGFDQEYKVTDLISGNEYIWKDEMNFVELNPTYMPVHLFKI
ncbi:MAG: alpha-1,4-glucan--maltose-1-phosphate maltosyltransferase, partial [Bacteroidota bacterium]